MRDEFIGSEAGDGGVYRIAEEIMGVLARHRLDFHEAGAVLALCMDGAMSMAPPEYREDFKASTIDLLRDLFSVKPARAAS